MGGGDQKQLVPVQFAPAASVTIPKLDEKDGPVKFVLPVPRLHLILPLIDFDERAGPDQRIQGVVIESDIAAEAFPQIQLLQEGEGDFAPRFKHPRHKIRPREFHILAEFYRKNDRLPWQFQIGPNQVGVWQTDQALFPGGVENINPEESHDFQVITFVDEAQAVKLVYARGKLPVFHVGQPAMGNAD
jgi:hypothetical protein